MPTGWPFSDQEIITPEAQGRWFKNYQERPDDWMFVVRVEGQTIGCMGFRLIDLEADVYNVILGGPEPGAPRMDAPGAAPHVQFCDRPAHPRHWGQGY